MSRCLSAVGEPLSEIPHAPHLFSLAAISTDMFLLQGKKFIFYVDTLVIGY